MGTLSQLTLTATTRAMVVSDANQGLYEIEDDDSSWWTGTVNAIGCVLAASFLVRFPSIG